MLTDDERTYVRFLLTRKIARKHQFRSRWMTAKEIAAVTGLSERTVRRRIQHGLPLEGPVRIGPKPKTYEFRGGLATIYEIMEATGLTRKTALKHISGNVFIENPDNSNAPSDPRRDAFLLTYSGKTQSLSQWARELGIPVSTLFSRLVYGWPTHEALTRPIERKGKRAVRLLAINRMVRSFRAGRYQPTTGGHEATFHTSPGTGAGRHETHFDGRRP